MWQKYKFPIVSMYLRLNILYLNVKINKLKQRCKCVKGKLRVEANYRFYLVAMNTNK